VAPPNIDIKKFLHPARKHPFYDSGDIEWMLARRGDDVVGRIAAIENRAHNDHHDDHVGFFGFFDTEDDPEVSAALFDAAGAWLRARGLTALRGPTSPSLNYESGLLIEGDPGHPTLMMPYNPLWYRRHIESAGFRKEMDLYAFFTNEEGHDIERWERIADRLRSRHQVSIRPLDMSRFEADVRLIVDLFNDAWSRNWGFVPMSQREIDAMAKELKPIVAPWLCSFLIRDGEEVGFWLGIPDYNSVLLKLKGRLFPFGFLKLLRAKRRLSMMRVLLMGVRKEHQHLGLDIALYSDICKTGLGNGVTSAECGWVLETNAAMINTMERAGGRRWRTYRVFERDL